MILAVEQLVIAGLGTLAQSPLKPNEDAPPPGPWWGVALAMFTFAVMVGIAAWLIQWFSQGHDRRRRRAATELGFDSIADDPEAVKQLREKLAKLRLRLGGGQLRSAHAGRFEGWSVTFVDARERDMHHMAFVWAGDGQVEPCPRSLVLLERAEMALPDFMLEPDNMVYRLGRGERRPLRAPRDLFERRNRLAVGGERAAMLLSDDLRRHLANNLELTVRGRGSLVAVSTDRRHVPDRQWHAFLAGALVIAEALHEASEAVGPAGDDADDADEDARSAAEREGEAMREWEMVAWAEAARRPGRLW